MMKKMKRYELLIHITKSRYAFSVCCQYGISTSINNKIRKDVDERSDIETGDNTEIFVLSSPVKCKIFRILFLETSNETETENDEAVAFTTFDCFVKVVANRTKYVPKWKRRFKRRALFLGDK